MLNCSDVKFVKLTCRNRLASRQSPRLHGLMGSKSWDMSNGKETERRRSVVLRTSLECSWPERSCFFVRKVPNGVEKRVSHGFSLWSSRRLLQLFPTWRLVRLSEGKAMNLWQVGKSPGDPRRLKVLTYLEKVGHQTDWAPKALYSTAKLVQTTRIPKVWLQKDQNAKICQRCADHG